MEASSDWSRFHQDRLEKSAFPKWPESSLVKLAFGSYLSDPICLTPAARVLDVGCGFGNNLLPHAEAGRHVAGVELSETIAATARRLLLERGHEGDVRVGHNRAIPFDENEFDLLLSVNALHYEGSRANVGLALKEFQRVLRPGGRLLLMTVAPEHEIREHCESIGDGSYRITGYDFRDGEIMFYFSTEDELAVTLLSSFCDVETGRVTESLMTRKVDFFVASATADG